MTSGLTTRPRPSRPLPLRVAPPTAPLGEDTSAPWAALLAEPLEAGAFEWVMGAEGALVPVPVGTTDVPGAARRRWLVSRLLRR